MGAARISRVFGAVNLGSFRVSAMIMGLTEGGDLIVLGSSHRASAAVPLVGGCGRVSNL